LFFCRASASGTPPKQFEKKSGGRPLDKLPFDFTQDRRDKRRALPICPELAEGSKRNPPQADALQHINSNSSQLLRNGHFEVTPEKGNFVECGGHNLRSFSEEGLPPLFL